MARGTYQLRSLNIHLPPVSGFARKKHPLQNTTTAWGLACAPSNRGFPSWCQRLPSSAPHRAQDRHQISSWHLGGGWMGREVQLPLSSLQKSILVKETAAGSAGWPGLPRGLGSVPGSGSPSCEMKAETILQEIK